MKLIQPNDKEIVKLNELNDILPDGKLFIYLFI